MQVSLMLFFVIEVSKKRMNVEYVWTNEIVLVSLSQTSQIIIIFNKIVLTLVLLVLPRELDP